MAAALAAAVGVHVAQQDQRQTGVCVCVRVFMLTACVLQVQVPDMYGLPYANIKKRFVSPHDGQRCVRKPVDV